MLAGFLAALPLGGARVQPLDRMRFDPDSEEAQKRMEALIEEMQGQTDRGVAIVGAAWVEEAMSAAIESFLHSDRKAWDRLFGIAGPLGTLSAKIDLARLLGMVSDSIKSDLHIIRDVRNEFAHRIAHKTEHTKLAFSSPHIRDKCLALKCIAHEKHAEPRVAFIQACAILNADFEAHSMFGIKITDGGHIVARIDHAI